MESVVFVTNDIIIVDIDENTLVDGEINTTVILRTYLLRGLTFLWQYNIIFQFKMGRVRRNNILVWQEV